MCFPLVVELKMVLVKTWCDKAPEVVFCKPVSPDKFFQAYGNTSMLDYTLGTAYNLLYVPLLCILDTCFTQLGEVSGAASTDLLWC